jgi:ABC-type lipoprotein release transport system permease subunit
LLITIVTALIAVSIMFMAANTASMTVRERVREIAILKTIGFSRRVAGTSSWGPSRGSSSPTRS